MKSRMVAVFCALALLGADKPDDKKADELEGAWTFASIVENGEDQKAPPEEVKFTFLPAGKMVMQLGQEKREATYTSDATKKPKTLDLVPGEGPQQGKTIKLIYAVDGDTLTLCGGHGPDDPRPTELASKKDSKLVLITLKREKK